MRLLPWLILIACGWASFTGGAQVDQLVHGNFVGSVDAEGIGCGCGEGKMARVALATHEFAAKVDSLGQELDDLVAAMDLRRRELPDIADRYREVASNAQADLSAGSTQAVVFDRYNPAIETFHETLTVLTSAFQQTREPFDQALADVEQACRQRQPPPGVEMSAEVREWSGACERVAAIGSRYLAELSRWQSAVQVFRDLDRSQWQEWRALAERVGDAR